MTQENSKDFFISYNRHDRAWAKWIAQQMAQESYSIIIEPCDAIDDSVLHPSKRFYVCGCYYHPERRDRYRDEKEKRQQVIQVVDLASGEVKREVRAREVWEVT